MPRWTLNIVGRFLSKFEAVNDGCWIWQGHIDIGGYGRLHDGVRSGKGAHSLPAHVFSYELFIGPVPDGYDVDHQCHNRDSSCMGGKTCRHRRCVNPWHMESSTRQVNLLRGISATGSKTHCPQGHEYNEENTRHYTYPSGQPARFCRQCDRDRRAA